MRYDDASWRGLLLLWGYGLADTGIHDNPLQISIIVSSDSVYISPTSAMRLHQYQCYLLRFLNYYVGSTDNSRRNKRVVVQQILHTTINLGYMNGLYLISSMIWPYREIGWRRYGWMI